MKASTATFYILAALSLVVSLTVLIFTSNNNFATPSKTPNTQTPTNTQTTSTNTPSNNELTFSYTFSNFEKLNTTEQGENKVTLSVTIQYQGKTSKTISYSQFYMGLYVFNKAGEQVETDLTIPPQNQGTVTLGPEHTTETIKLTFQYPATIQYDGKTATTYYFLQYKDDV
ncbi:MAG: hypothetical protein ACQCN3_11940 [Candidatus Bathyarchaeia archaeon]|jgi:hypothetical protein